MDPDNPHYFLGVDGQPLLLLSHASNTLVGDDITEPLRGWYLDQCAAAGLNLVRVNSRKRAP